MTETRGSFGRMAAYYVGGFFAVALLFIFVGNPSAGRAGQWLMLEAVCLGAVWWGHAGRPVLATAGPQTASLPVHVRSSTPVPVPQRLRVALVPPTPSLPVEVRSSAPVQPSSSAATPAKAARQRPGADRRVTVVDLTQPGKLNDCCVNCGSNAVCWPLQRDLEANYDFHCDDYQRDAALTLGPVVDVGRRGKS